MLFLIFYNVFAVPVAIAFQLEVPPTHPWFWAELLFDVVFLIDVVLNFNTAVMTEHAGLSFSRRKIACEYLSFWFWIDFPSSIPLAQVFSLVSFAAHPTGNTGESSQILKTVKMIRLARILKLMRIMKAMKIFRIFEEEMDINPAVIKLFKMVFTVLFMCHLMGCFAYLISTQTQVRTRVFACTPATPNHTHPRSRPPSLLTISHALSLSRLFFCPSSGGVHLRHVPPSRVVGLRGVCRRLRQLYTSRLLWQKNHHS